MKNINYLIALLAGMFIALLTVTIIEINKVDRLKIELKSIEITLSKTIQKNATLEANIFTLKEQLKSKIENKENVLKYLLRHSVIDTETLKIILNEVEKTTNPLLLLAIFKKESHYNPYAESKKGAIGLGQIMPIHVKELKKAGIKLETKRDLFNIKNNVQATEYLMIKFMKKANNDIYKMLRYYYGIHDNKYFVPVIANYFHLKMLTNTK